MDAVGRPLGRAQQPGRPGLLQPPAVGRAGVDQHHAAAAPARGRAVQRHHHLHRRVLPRQLHGPQGGSGHHDHLSVRRHPPGQHPALRHPGRARQARLLQPAQRLRHLFRPRACGGTRCRLLALPGDRGPRPHQPRGVLRHRHGRRYVPGRVPGPLRRGSDVLGDGA